MKKILVITMLIFGMLPVFAEQQTITNEQSYGIANIEKTPKNEGKQSIKNTKSWFCINVIINGKSKTDNSALSNAKE